MKMSSKSLSVLKLNSSKSLSVRDLTTSEDIANIYDILEDLLRKYNLLSLQTQASINLSEAKRIRSNLFMPADDFGAPFTVSDYELGVKYHSFAFTVGLGGEDSDERSFTFDRVKYTFKCKGNELDFAGYKYFLPEADYRLISFGIHTFSKNVVTQYRPFIHVRSNTIVYSDQGIPTEIISTTFKRYENVLTLANYSLSVDNIDDVVFHSIFVTHLIENYLSPIELVTQYFDYYTNVYNFMLHCSLLDTYMEYKLSLDELNLLENGIEYLTLNNTNDIISILKHIENVPYYQEMSGNTKTNTYVDYTIPLFMTPLFVKHTTQSNDSYSFNSLNPKFTHDLAVVQNLTNSTNSNQSNVVLLIDEASYSVYLVYEIMRIKLDDTILGEKQSKYLNLNTVKIDENNLYARVYANYNNVDPFISLRTNNTETTVYIRSVFVHIKESFSYPTDLLVTGSASMLVLDNTYDCSLNNAAVGDVLDPNGQRMIGFHIYIDKQFKYNFNGTIGFWPDALENFSLDVVPYTDKFNTVSVDKNIKYNDTNIDITTKFGAMVSVGGRTYKVENSIEVTGSVPIGRLHYNHVEDAFPFIDFNDAISRFKFQFEIGFKCNRAVPIGYQGVIDVYNSMLTDLEGYVLAIVNELNFINSQLYTISQQIENIYNWIDQQNKSSSWLDIILDLVLNAASELILPLIGPAIVAGVKSIIRNISKVVSTVAKYFSLFGVTVVNYALRISQSFMVASHMVKQFIVGWVARFSNKQKYADYVDSVARKVAKKDFLLSKATKNLFDEVRLLEYYNLVEKFPNLFHNLPTSLNKPVASHIDVHYTAFSTSTNLPGFVNFSRKIVNSKLGNKVSTKNLSPSHAKIVVTVYDSENMYKYILGVQEGLSPNKGIHVGSFRITYKKQDNIYIPVRDISDANINILFRKYFDGTVTDVNQQWLLLTSKFSTTPKQNLKTVSFNMPNSYRILALHDTFKVPKYFDYNLLTNNCQSFAQDAINWLNDGVVSSSLLPYAKELVEKYVNFLNTDLSSVLA